MSSSQRTHRYGQSDNSMHSRMSSSISGGGGGHQHGDSSYHQNNQYGDMGRYGKNSHGSNHGHFYKCTEVLQWDALHSAAAEFHHDEKLHLRHLCNDVARCTGLTAVHVSTWGAGGKPLLGGGGVQSRSRSASLGGGGNCLGNGERGGSSSSIASYDDGSFLTNLTMNDHHDHDHDHDLVNDESNHLNCNRNHNHGGNHGGGNHSRNHSRHDSMTNFNFLDKIEESSLESSTNSFNTNLSQSQHQNQHNRQHSHPLPPPPQQQQPHQQPPCLFDRSKMILDYSRQQVTGETMELLFDLADAVQFIERREAFRNGERINITEDKPVLHHLLRMPKGYDFPALALSPSTYTTTRSQSLLPTMNAKPSLSAMHRDGSRPAAVAQALPVDDALQAIHDVRDKIELFTRQIRSPATTTHNDPTSTTTTTNGDDSSSSSTMSGSFRGVTNKQITDTIVVSSSGGMHLGTKFVHRALSSDKRAALASKGRKLHFLSNVDPVDTFLETQDLDPERTMVVVVSKDFSNSLELSNFRVIRQWLISKLVCPSVPTASTPTTASTTASPTQTESSISAEAATTAAAATAAAAVASAKAKLTKTIHRKNTRRRGGNPFIDMNNITTSTTDKGVGDGLVADATTTADATATATATINNNSKTNVVITESDISERHIVAVTCCDSAHLSHFMDIPEKNIFRIWDWVIGRFSVCSAAGILPLSLQYSYDIVSEFLNGAHDMDEHFFNAPLRDNIPVLLGLLGVWNSTFMGYTTRALIPYSEALRDLSSYVSLVDMESNGKRVAVDGSELHHAAGEIHVGEPGGNTNHPFFSINASGSCYPNRLFRIYGITPSLGITRRGGLIKS